mgnify:CR=1 FL=1
MTRRIYLDVNIFRDYLEDRKNKFGQGLENRAEKVFDRTFSCEFEIVVSDWAIRQLSQQGMLQKAMILFQQLLERNKIIRIKTDKEDIDEAKKSGNYDDCLHAILAKKSNAECIVTRNVPDFLPFARLIEPKLPERL